MGTGAQMVSGIDLSVFGRFCYMGFCVCPESKMRKLSVE